MLQPKCTLSGHKPSHECNEQQAPTKHEAQLHRYGRPKTNDNRKPDRLGRALFCGETEIRTRGPKNRSQLSRLLHYHSATSPLSPSTLESDGEFTANDWVNANGLVRKRHSYLELEYYRPRLQIGGKSRRILGFSWCILYTQNLFSLLCLHQTPPA